MTCSVEATDGHAHATFIIMVAAVRSMWRIAKVPVGVRSSPLPAFWVPQRHPTLCGILRMPYHLVRQTCTVSARSCGIEGGCDGGRSMGRCGRGHNTSFDTHCKRRDDGWTISDRRIRARGGNLCMAAGTRSKANTQIQA